jgi:hypothetical protein
MDLGMIRDVVRRFVAEVVRPSDDNALPDPIMRTRALSVTEQS